MDDYLDSWESETEAAEIAEQIRTINRAAGFEMHSWGKQQRKSSS